MQCKCCIYFSQSKGQSITFSEIKLRSFLNVVWLLAIYFSLPEGYHIFIIKYSVTLLKIKLHTIFRLCVLNRKIRED